MTFQWLLEFLIRFGEMLDKNKNDCVLVHKGNPCTRMRIQPYRRKERRLRGGPLHMRLFHTELSPEVLIERLQHNTLQLPIFLSLPHLH